MLMYRTIEETDFWVHDSMQNLSGIVPLFCTPTWPSRSMSENQEFCLFEVLELHYYFASVN